MYQIHVNVPEISPFQEREITIFIDNSTKTTLKIPNLQGISLDLSNLTIKSTFLITESGENRSFSMCFGDFLPSLEGKIDQWFRFEGKEEEKASFRLVLVVKKGSGVLGNEGCGRCQASGRRVKALEMQLAAMQTQTRVFPMLSRELEMMKIEDLTLHYPQSLAQQERDFYHYKLLALHTRSQTTDSLQLSLLSTQNQLQSSLSQHSELTTITHETSLQLTSLLSQLKKDIHNSVIDRKNERDNSEKLKTQIEDMKRNQRKNREKIREMNKEIGTLKETNEELKEILMRKKQENDELEAVINKNKELNSFLDQLNAEIRENNAKNSTIQHQITTEKNQISLELQKTRQLLLEKTSKFDELMLKLSKFEGQNEELALFRRVEKEQKDTIEELNRTIGDIKEKYDEKVAKLKGKISDLEGNLNEIVRENETFGCENGLLRDEIAKLTRENVNLESLHASASGENLSLRGKMALLEQGLCMQEDIYRSLELLSHRDVENTELVGRLSEEVNTLTQALLQQSEKALAAQLVIAKLTEVIEKLNGELKLMRQIMMHPAPYVPLPSDPIDTALSLYLNNRLVPCPLPFKREEPGIYSFGSRKVTIKLENSRLITRVGGGFMGIDDFVLTYGPLELEKLENRRNMQGVEPLLMRLSQCLEGQEASGRLTNRSEPSPRRKPAS